MMALEVITIHPVGNKNICPSFIYIPYLRYFTWNQKCQFAGGGRLKLKVPPKSGAVGQLLGRYVLLS